MGIQTPILTDKDDFPDQIAVQEFTLDNNPKRYRSWSPATGHIADHEVLYVRADFFREAMKLAGEEDKDE